MTHLTHDRPAFLCPFSKRPAPLLHSTFLEVDSWESGLGVVQPFLHHRLLGLCRLSPHHHQNGALPPQESTPKRPWPKVLTSSAESAEDLGKTEKGGYTAHAAVKPKDVLSAVSPPHCPSRSVRGQQQEGFSPPSLRIQPWWLLSPC